MIFSPPPQLWVMAGPNGAGKSSLAALYGLTVRLPVISPDTLALIENLKPLAAGRRALEERSALLARKADFAVETTLSGRQELILMQQAAGQGYKVTLLFVGLESPKLCQSRVLQRVAAGGHNVSPAEISRRFRRSVANLAAAMASAHRVLVLDNSWLKPRLLLSVEHQRVKFRSPHLPAWAQQAIPLPFRQRCVMRGEGRSEARNDELYP